MLDMGFSFILIVCIIYIAIIFTVYILITYINSFVYLLLSGAIVAILLFIKPDIPEKVCENHIIPYYTVFLLIAFIFSYSDCHKSKGRIVLLLFGIFVTLVNLYLCSPFLVPLTMFINLYIMITLIKEAIDA